MIIKLLSIMKRHYKNHLSSFSNLKRLRNNKLNMPNGGRILEMSIEHSRKLKEHTSILNYNNRSGLLGLDHPLAEST